ncbi:MAG: fibronectin type III domain-containing protein [Saprospiraceae bacterium]|nr:fibronectin type III domain-containing protein [Saprospiraceae bacterium]
MKRLLLTMALGLGLGLVVGFAQPYAVTTNIQTTSFSKYLDDYAQPNRVFVTLLSTDSRPSYQAFLQIEIAGDGFNLKSRPNFIPPPITLYKDQPITLSGLSLAPYLNPNNLDFNGMSLDAFLSSGGRLPDGPITICIEAYDFNRLGYPPISNTACSYGTIMTNAPPIVTAPIGYTQAANPQNFMLSWQPQHVGAFPVEYTVEIYRDNTGFSPDVTVNSTAPIFTTRTSLTTYNYSAIDPLLINGEDYLIRVKAADLLGVNYFDNEGWSVIEAFHYGGECPSPVGVSFGEISDTYLEVLWQLEESQGVNYIEVSIENESEEVIYQTQLSRGENRFTFEGLEPGRAYTITVCSNCEGAGQTCVELGPISTKGEGECEPRMVESFRLQESFPFYAILDWQPISGAMQYEVRYREREGGSWTTFAIAGNESQVKVANLIPGTTYEAQIRVRCFEGEPGPWSDSVIWNSDCAAPDIVWVESFDHESALFAWFSSPYAKNYRLQYRRKGTNSWSNVYTTESSKTITGLQPSTTYEYRLKLKCLDNSWSSYSPIFEFTTLQDCDPINAEAIRFTNITASSATVTVPHSDLVEYYLVKYKAVGASSYEVIQSTTSVIDIEFLEPNTTYEVIIANDCYDNWSDWTSPLNFTTLCGASDLAWAEQITAFTATLLTNSINGADQYQFEYRQKGSGEWITMPASTDLHVDLSGLADLTTYEIRVRSKCGGSWSDPSVISEFTTGENCSAPSTITVSNESPSGFDLSWTNNPRVDRWQVHLRAQDGSPISGLKIPGLGNEIPGVDGEGWTFFHVQESAINIDGLADNTTYDIRIRAFCSDVIPSDFSSTFTGTTLSNCQPPNNIWFDNFNGENITINWTPEPYNNLWEVAYRPKPLEGRNGSWTNRTIEGTPSLTLTGLQEGQDYEFKIKSSCSNFGWTDFGPIGNWNHGPCGAPTNVTEDITSSTTVKLTWTGSGFATYTVLYRPMGIPGAQYTSVNTNATNIELTGLQTGTIYEYTIAANCFGSNTSFTYDDDFEIERESLDNEFYECGVDLTPPDLSSFVPLQELRKGDTIIVGDFTVIVATAFGSPGRFSGTGYLPVPYLNMARVNVTFDNITINDKTRVVQGEVIITGAGVQLLSEAAADALDNFLQVLSTVDDVLAYAEDVIEMAENLVQNASNYLPDQVVQQLSIATQALEDAVASGNQSDIMAAKNQLDSANTAFKTELQSFFTQFFSIVKTTLQQISIDCNNLSASQADYDGKWQQIDQYQLGAINQLSLMNGQGLTNYDLLHERVEVSEETSSFNDLDPSFIPLRDQFYSVEKDYMTCAMIEQIEGDILIIDEVHDLGELLEMVEYNLLDEVGSKIKAGDTSASIIQGLKIELKNLFEQLLIEKSYGK